MDREKLLSADAESELTIETIKEEHIPSATCLIRLLDGYECASAVFNEEDLLRLLIKRIEKRKGIKFITI